METRHIRVERAFFLSREVQPVGAVIEVPKSVAAGLIAAGKASAAPAPAVEYPPPVEAEPQPEPESRGKKHARK